MRAAVVAVTAFIAIAGCSTGGEQGNSTRETASSAQLQSSADPGQTGARQSADSLRDDFVEHGLSLPDSRLEVIRQIGQPDSIIGRTVTNRHNPAQTDSIIDLFYRGLHVTYYVVGASGREFLQTAIVTDNRYLKFPQFGIGASEGVILQSFGEAAERAMGKFRYDCARCIGAESPVYFYFDSGKVQRIEFSFYLD